MDKLRRRVRRGLDRFHRPARCGRLSCEMSDAPAPTRLADLLGTLSLSTDLAAGAPMETSLRTCTVAARLACVLGLDEAAVSDAYYVGLLRHLGCTAFAHEAAASAAGDDHDFLRTFEAIDPLDRLATAKQIVGGLARGKGARARAEAVGRTLLNPSLATSLAKAQCAQAAALATDLGMTARVANALEQIYERYDGSGAPNLLEGEQIELAARILHVATLVEIQYRHGGRARVLDVVRARRGRQLDPRVVDAFTGETENVWSLLSSTSAWEKFLDAEPGAPRMIRAEDRGALALTFGRYADLKAPSRLGHSPAVADLACQAAAADGFEASEVETLRLAALLHDLGVVGVPNGVWEKRGPLNMVDWERVRRHPYDTERILLRGPSLAPVAAIAGAHHERGDGTGYPRGAAPPPLARAARLLAGADAYVAMIADRPHRRALSSAAAADELRRDVAAGRLCPRATDAVLAAAGVERPVREVPAVDLTARETDVLVEVARGSTNKEIAVALGIAARTVKHHLENIYAKAGVNTRSGAALFAVRHGLVRP
jgi:HD-GYP domain-containing protein (c-di-GMP phosphodiesterase class II)